MMRLVAFSCAAFLATLPAVAAAEKTDQGRAALIKGDYEQAVLHYTKSIRIDPKKASNYYVRAYCLLMLEKFDPAIEDLNECIKLQPDYAAAFNSRAFAYGKKKDLKRSLQDYDEAVRLEPRNARTRNDRGSVYLLLNENDKAIDDFDEAIRLDPKLVFAYTNRGDAYAKRDQYDKAIEDYSEAIRLSPNDALSYDGRGVARAKQRDYERALSDHHQAIRFDPKAAIFHVHRGHTYEEKEDYEQALQDYAEANLLDSRIFSEKDLDEVKKRLPSAAALPAATDLITNSIGMKLTFIPAGEFQKGSDDGNPDDEPLARITKPFYLGQTEVTQGQWQAVMGDSPWQGDSNVKEGADYPATCVSWDAAVEFCGKLSTKEGRKYRLPTEAEWEYACRAGTSTKFSFGQDDSRMGEYAWWGGLVGDGNAKNEPFAHRVATKRPNPWGLYDMHGNAAEWCDDAWDDAVFGTPKGLYRTTRGGNWEGPSDECRSSCASENCPASVTTTWVSASPYRRFEHHNAFGCLGAQTSRMNTFSRPD